MRRISRIKCLSKAVISWIFRINTRFEYFDWLHWSEDLEYHLHLLIFQQYAQKRPKAGQYFYALLSLYEWVIKHESNQCENHSNASAIEFRFFPFYARVPPLGQPLPTFFLVRLGFFSRIQGWQTIKNCEIRGCPTLGHLSHFGDTK